MFRIRNFFKVKLWVKIIAVGIPVALMGYLAWHFVVTPWLWCGPGVKKVEDQCIGVTDGEVKLSADLAGVLDEIWEENKRIEQENPDADVVSVAYLMPLPKPSADVELSAEPRLRHELQGAHIAQLEANKTARLGRKPLIRLLVANSGDESSQWQRVVPTLLAKMGTEKLVTVVATGNTVDATLKVIEDLRVKGLPVVMSRLAGDSLPTPDPDAQNNPPGGLARLAPSGRDQGAAAAVYLKQTANRALIVRDINPKDPFVEALDEAFRSSFSDDTHKILNPPETYNSQLKGVSNAMIGILRNICVQEPDVVYFAGRNLALNDFVQALPRRPCPELPIDIMASGGSTADLAVKIAMGDSELTEGMNANATVQYTAQAHPGAWEDSSESFSSASTSRLSGDCPDCFPAIFRGETLDDGGAIIGYDAILTAVTAIRPPDQENPNQENVINDEPELVTQQFGRLHGKDAVPGATGWISLDADGNPMNKAVVILQINPDGALQFRKLSSPSPLGAPCVPDLVDRMC